MERSEFDIREHRNAGLTKNARVCLHAEADTFNVSAFGLYDNVLLLLKNGKVHPSCLPD